MEFPVWFEEALITQRPFLLGCLCMLVAICMRRSGSLKVEDAVPICRVAFNVCFPCMLFTNIWKLEIDSSLQRVAVVSIFTNLVHVLIVMACSHFAVKDKVFRGQVMFSMSGFNIGFVYPLILASKTLRDTVFPALVIWDLAGNVPVIFVYNVLVAMVHAPSAAPSDSQSGAQGTNFPPTPSTLSTLHTSPVAENEPSQVRVSDIEEDFVSPTQQSEDGQKQQRLSTLGTLGVVIRRISMSPPLIAEVLGVAVNFSGMRLPASIDGLIDIIGSAFPLLFFLLVGLNLVWSRVRPQLTCVFAVVICRLSLGVVVGAVIWALGVLPTRPWLLAGLLVLASPVSGLSMSMAIDFGYDSLFQAALMAASNFASFFALWALMNLA